jgi:hypothetical protein
MEKVRGTLNVKVLKVNGVQVGAAQAAKIADASAAHTINGTFSNTEVKAALDALGAKVNALIDALEGFGVSASS